MTEPTTTPSVADRAVAAADGTRTAARWLASALGAIPSLAVLSAIIRAPGEPGFDPLKLSLGVGLAALGALIGVLAFAHVLTPLALEDKDLKDLDLRRLPGHPYATTEDLDGDLAKYRQGVTDHEARVAVAEAASQTADTRADEAEATAAQAEADGSSNAAALRAEAEKLRAAATAASTRSTLLVGALKVWNDQLTRHEAIRRDAFLLLSADRVRGRFTKAKWATGVAVALIAAGTVLLGLAPNPKSTATTPVLVTLTLTPAGRTALGCEVPSVPALKVGGTDTEPKVITLPVDGCPAKTLTFTAADKDPMGTVEVVRQVGGS